MMNLHSFTRLLARLLCIGVLIGLAPLPGRLFLPAAGAQLHPPEVRGVYPLGGRSNGTTRVTITGVSFRDASAFLFDRPGIVAKIVPPNPSALPAANADSDGNPPVVADFTVAKEAAPGVYRFRIVAPSGVSSVGKWAVGRDMPDSEEVEPNNEISQAQAVSLPTAVNGHISVIGDQDVFGFDLDAGKTFVAEVNAATLDSPLDSLLTLRAADGTEVAENDDYNGPDSLLLYAVKKTGRYFITLSSSVELGGPDQAYRLSLGYLPVLQALYPAGVTRGATTTLRPVGVNLPPTLTVGPAADSGAATVRVYSQGLLFSNALPVMVTPWATVQEQEPNDDPLHATPLPVPCVASGRFLRLDGKADADIDYYKFHAEAGHRYIMEAQCQAIGTRGDPILTLFDAAGAQLEENDDAVGRDSRLDRTFDKAGDYFLRVRESGGRTGADLVYRLLISEPGPPDFTLSTETRGRVVGRGDRVAFEVNVARDRWDGPVTLTAADLPAGVTAEGSVVPAGFGRGIVVLAATANATPGPFPLHIVGMAQIGGKTVQRTLQSAADWVWKGGARQSVAAPSELLMFDIGAPFEVAPQADATTLTVELGKSVKFKVRLTRRVPYAKPVTLVMLGLPDGVTAANVVLQPNMMEAEIEIKAVANARQGVYSIVADAQAMNSPQVALDRPTQPILLTVSPPAPPKK